MTERQITLMVAVLNEPVLLVNPSGTPNEIRAAIIEAVEEDRLVTLRIPADPDAAPPSAGQSLTLNRDNISELEVEYLRDGEAPFSGPRGLLTIQGGHIR